MDAVREASSRIRDPLPTSVLDTVLTAQFAVAWAGERGERPRLGWWRSDLISPDGGEDLFSRLVPSTWQWAVYQAVREAARRRDVERRSQVHDPDSLLTLFSLGFETDERLEERLFDLKRSQSSPIGAFPELAEVIVSTFRKDDFSDWALDHGTVEFVVEPAGRRLKGSPPESLELLVHRLVAALVPFDPEYPMPHYRRSS